MEIPAPVADDATHCYRSAFKGNVTAIPGVGGDGGCLGGALGGQSGGGPELKVGGYVGIAGVEGVTCWESWAGCGSHFVQASIERLTADVLRMV